jgi:hypothetical protein
MQKITKSGRNIAKGIFEFVLLFGANVALAQGDVSGLPGVDFTVQDLVRIISRIACYLINTVLAIMIIVLIIAGVKFFLARGNPTDVADAKKNLTWVLVGIAVIIGTNIIIATVAGWLGATYSPLTCSPVRVL